MGMDLKLFICIAGVCLAHAVQLQTGKQRTMDPLEEDCKCLNWQDVYRNSSYYGITCGQGNEFYYKTKMGEPWQFVKQSLAGDTLCATFYERLPDNTCMNMEFRISEDQLKSSYDHPQWCYVSSRCYYLNGGTRLTKRASYKKCIPGEDNTLESKTPQELMEWQKNTDLDIALLVKMAYPTWPGDTWEKVKPFWEQGATFNSTASSNLTGMQRGLLSRLVGWKKHVVFDGLAGHTSAKGSPWYPTLGVVNGKKVYEVNFAMNSSFFNLARARRHPGKLNKLECVMDCEPPLEE